MHVILCTIPHTGTNFFEKVFKDAGFVTVGPHKTAAEYQNLDPNGRWFTRLHISKDALRFCAQRQRQGANLVTVFRPYAETEESWKARRRDKKENLSGQYNLWHEFVCSLKPHVLTLSDKLGREASLLGLGQKLGVEFSPNWDEKLNERKKK